MSNQLHFLTSNISFLNIHITIIIFWKIPSTTHCNLLPSTNKSLPIEFLIEKRCAKFICSSFNTHTLIVRNISLAAKISSFSDFGDNYRYLRYEYGIGIHVGHLPLCKLYKCFDLYLLKIIICLEAQY